MNEPKMLYQKRSNYYAARKENLSHRINQLSNVRLITFLAGCGLASFFYMTHNTSWSLGTAILTAVSFVTLVIWHQNLKARNNYIQILYENYDHSLKRLTGEWKSFLNKGKTLKTHLIHFLRILTFLEPILFINGSVLQRPFGGGKS
ncbi:MAG: hypothetical protein NHB14_03665 [Desulfosporosinus sp.]|nr:hypothetical protein [Desulfosporosinus sp.]